MNGLNNTNNTLCSSMWMTLTVTILKEHFDLTKKDSVVAADDRIGDPAFKRRQGAVEYRYPGTRQLVSDAVKLVEKRGCELLRNSCLIAL